jgi:hypothetical protein
MSKIVTEEQAAQRGDLVNRISIAKEALAHAEVTLHQFDAKPENNVYATLDDAVGYIEEELRDEASGDCEGSYNCGAPQYHRHFMVDGVEYIGTLTVEYNRHDKTYYYVEEASFTHRTLAEDDVAA